tara:strand:+ start:177 stop:932 length:756 start_codon:yes stop_codon:yes gene_type:complete
MTTKYYIARHCPRITELPTANVIFNQYGVTVFSIEPEWVRELNRLSGSYEEVTETLGRWGTKHFGEIRAVVKVTDEDPLTEDEEYALEQLPDGRTKVELPQERYDAAIGFMKVAAKLIIEDEYDRRFLTLKAEESKIEQYLWNAQIEEANNLEGETPLLNSIATTKGITVSEVAESVLAGNKTFNEKVQTLYNAMLALKKEFKDCTTVRELNVLWQKYMGVTMPYAQMLEEPDIYLDEDGNPKPVNPGLQF